MCGRFTLTIDPGELQSAFPGIQVPAGMAPRFNIAPSQPVAVITNENPAKLDFFSWGLIPSWAKDPSIGSNLINARSETLSEKPSFRNAYRRRRCLIPADGFYEWKKSPDGKTKEPVFITMKDNAIFAFGGLWEIWYSPDGSEIRSCTIITTQPNREILPIHNRMPAIIQPSNYNSWLAPGEIPTDQLTGLLQPYPDGFLAIRQVSRLVNNPRIDSPDCILPAAG